MTAVRAVRRGPGLVGLAQIEDLRFIRQVDIAQLCVRHPVVSSAVKTIDFVSEASEDSGARLRREHMTAGHPALGLQRFCFSRPPQMRRAARCSAPGG